MKLFFLIFKQSYDELFKNYIEEKNFTKNLMNTIKDKEKRSSINYQIYKNVQNLNLNEAFINFEQLNENSKKILNNIESSVKNLISKNNLRFLKTSKKENIKKKRKEKITSPPTINNQPIKPITSLCYQKIEINRFNPHQSEKINNNNLSFY